MARIAGVDLPRDKKVEIGTLRDPGFKSGRSDVDAVNTVTVAREAHGDGGPDALRRARYHHGLRHGDTFPQWANDTVGLMVCPKLS